MGLIIRTTLTFALLACCAEAAPVEFNRDIRPILSDKCFACHGPDEGRRTSKLRLDSEEGAGAALAGGKRAIVPGDLAASELIRRVASGDEAVRMPPAYMGHEKLTDREIELLRSWVRQGAEWQSHWAFLAPRRTTEPPAKRDSWVRNPIDSFVLERLQRNGLEPNSQAARATLIRRLSLDLTGLPPTPREIDTFLADASPNAYEKVVDRLLASPRYGERMAFRWLDAARYADTNGYQNDQERYMWRWRDWVIDAFNRNLPFDDFTVQQIAGDLLPNATHDQKLATGFNRNHRGNGELGIVPEEYHVEYVVDRVDTTATVFLGLTAGCARCHDHKYDPLTQKEFYQLYAYFNNVPDRGRYFKYGNTPPVLAAPTEEQRTKLTSVEAQLDQARRRLRELEPEAKDAQAAWEAGVSKAGSSWSYTTRRRIYLPLDEGDSFLEGDAGYAQGISGPAARFDGKSYIDSGDIANFGIFEPFTIAVWIKPQSSSGGIVTRMKPAATARGNKGWGVYLMEGKLQLRMESTDIDDRMIVETESPVELNRWTHVTVVYDGSRWTNGMKIYVDGEDKPLRVIIDHSNNDIKSNESPLRMGHGMGVDERYTGLIDEVQIFDRALSSDQVGVVSVRDSLSELAGIAPQNRSQEQKNKLDWAFRDRYATSAVQRAWRQVERLELERESLTASFPTVMVMDESPTPRQAHVLNRGVYDAPGEPVEPGVPAALNALPNGAPKNRLTLARWLVNRSNPLTARVTVNRFWQMLFGAGIVTTVEDFGSQGEWPTHPGLLDWLAVEFMESGWDVKGIFKTIVMSATYRQSTLADSDKRAKDPENSLLSRAPRLRLPAEMIRDQALAASGLLTDEIGGPSVKPYQPAGLWKELSNAGAYKNDHGDDLYRRSLYTFWKRTIAPPSMLNFDSSARETCIVRETRTNTPLQALNLMNDVTYVEASRLLAQRMLTEAGPTSDERLVYGFRLAVAREPDDSERAVLRRALNRALDRYQTSAADAEQLLDLGESDRDASLPADEHAAYANVASLMLNLDETITRE